MVEPIRDKEGGENGGCKCLPESPYSLEYPLTVKDLGLVGVVLMIVAAIVFAGDFVLDTSSTKDAGVDAALEDALDFSTQSAASTGDSFIRYVQDDLLNDTIATAKSEGLLRQEQVIDVEYSALNNWTIIYSMRR